MECDRVAFGIRLEWHYTPKHGSWLDLAESELGVLFAQCVDRRNSDKQSPLTDSNPGAALVQTLDPTNYEPIANPVLIRVALKVQKFIDPARGAIRGPFRMGRSSLFFETKCAVQVEERV